MNNIKHWAAVITASIILPVAFAATGTATNNEAQAEAEIDPDLIQSGGEVQVPGSGRGKIVILSSQKTVKLDDLKRPFRKVIELMMLPLEFREGDPIVPGPDAIKSVGANFVINVIDDPSKSAPLLLAPEEGWAIVNIAHSKKDDPTPTRLIDRARKQTMRGFGYLCGCANATYKNTVMGPMRKMIDMDRVPYFELPLDSYNRVLDYLAGYRVTRFEYSTYRTACKDGWAPAPTNKWQKAIWEEYKDPKKRFAKDFPGKVK